MKRRFALLASTALLLALAGCAGSSEPTTSAEPSAEGPISVTIGAVVTTSTVPIYIAQKEGIFEANGLDVTIEPVQNFAASVPSLLNGQLQFATGAVPAFLTAASENMPLLAVAGTSATVEDPEMEGNQLTVTAASGIQKVEDLKGATIATNAVGSGPYVAILAAYLRSGGAEGDINWVVMPLNEQIAALENGQIDGAVLAEPFTTMALKGGSSAVVSAYREPGSEIYDAGVPYVVLVGSTQYLSENPDVAKRMRTAMIEANEFAAANPDVVVDLLVSEAGIDAAIAPEIRLPGFVGDITGPDLQAMIDAMADAGMIKTQIDGKTLVWQP